MKPNPITFVLLAVAAAALALPVFNPSTPQRARAQTSDDAAPADPPAETAPPKAGQGATPAATAPAQTGSPSVLAAGGNVAVIRIDGMIYDFTLDSLKRRVDRAVKEGASVIVLELDTPGGVVTSALDIAKYLKSLNVPTVAWVNRNAYSAGILIASACNEIVMAPASATGDCAPIVPGMELAPTERAKALSPILTEFEDNAQTNGYDYAMFHAMCVLGVKLYLIENPQTGKRHLVNQVDYEIMVNGKSGENAWDSVKNFFGQESFDAPSRNLAEDSDRGKWKAVTRVGNFKFPDGLVHDGKTLLTVSQSKAVAIGLAKRDDIRTDSDLKQYLGAAKVATVHQSWSEDLAGWLTHPAVRAVLVLALLLGAYVEFQTPGVGVAGSVALLALITLLGAPFLIGLAEVWHIILFFVGFLLLLGEIFVTPGFGVLGISGLVCMLAGLVLGVVPTSSGGSFNLPAREALGVLQVSITATMVGVMLSIVGVYYLNKFFDSIPLLNRLVLRDPTPAPAMAGAAPAHVSGDEAIGSGQLQPGAVGQVTQQLRPSGRAEIDGQLIDVVSNGGWIEPGRPVRVVEVQGNRIVVEETDA